MVDIIMPCNIKVTIPEVAFECTRSIMENTKEYNFIIVGSKKTQPESINYGIEKANNKYFVIIDWDIKVPEGWLDKMIKVLEEDKAVGIVGPAMEGVYKDMFNVYTEEQGDGKVIEMGSAIGACMVCRNIGLKWDDNFESGYWADTDFGRQYKEAGYKIMLHTGVVIDHAVHTTAGKSDYVQKMMNSGEAYYFQKWGDLYV